MIRTHKDVENRYRITATAELSWLKGNSAPYFSLTADGRDRGSKFGGCCHEEILKHWPDLAPLAALHLSDIDGAPMHAKANGWYWLAGYYGGAGERYYGDKPSEDCLAIWADHVRLPIEQASAAAEAFRANWNFPDMRKAHDQFIDDQRPRWKQEADAAIEQFGLNRPSQAAA